MRVLICDDDYAFAKQCKTLLGELADKHGADATIDIVQSGRQLIFYMDSKYSDTDLIYLDYHMPGENGMQTAQVLRKHNSAAEIIFLTVDGSHALEGYDVDALHYIIKGETDSNRFEQVFLKALSRYKRKKEAVLSLSCAGERRNVYIQDILYFEVHNRIITAHYTISGIPQTFEFYSSLSRLEELLASDHFLRIHNSYLVSEKKIHKKTSQTVEMLDHSLLPIGRSYRGKV